MYKLKIKHDYTEIVFSFRDFRDMSVFLETVLNNAEENYKVEISFELNEKAGVE